MYDGRQYGYACNLAAAALLGNVDLFRKYGMNPPPEEWTPDQFEAMGTEFVRRANRGKPHREVSFTGPMPLVILPIARSEGADVFNETMTAPTLTAPAFVKALSRYHRWVSELHLIPTTAEIAAESANMSGVNGTAGPQLVSGHYAMILTGHYINMDLRRFRHAPVNLRFVQFPEYGFKNLILTSRNTAIYKGSKHKDLAKLFLLFLAGKDDNELIIHGSDGLPPNPKWAEGNPDYLAPKGRENEGDLHKNELKWALSIAIPQSRSPYYPLDDNKIEYACERVSGGLSTPKEALELANRSIEQSIREMVHDVASLRERYRRDCELQKKIDACKAAGKKIPAAWIKSPFYLEYYRRTGRLAE